MINNILIFGFALLFITAWGILCIYKYKKWIGKQKKCTQKLTVTVINILSKKTSRGDVVYKPIFTSKNTNDKILIDSAYYSNLLSFEIGQQLVLLINPENPKDFIYEDNLYNKGIIADILCCIVPFIFIIAILLATKY